jgi:ADP-ribosyl-[dinitrogen reductase] hydrolase
MALRDRQRGTLLGLAVGDALGAAVEFQMPGAFEEVTDFRGGGPHGLGPGEWTDDTSMALALADSIASAAWDLNDQMRRYVDWYRHGKYSAKGRCFDIGTTTVAALRCFEESGDARTSGDTSESASGNGSIMRLAPVPIRYGYLFPDGIGDLLERAVESSLPTHASPLCLSACAYLAVVLCGLTDGKSRDEVLDPNWGPMRRARDIAPFHAEIAEVADGSFRQKEPPEIVGSGYVVKSLEAALWAFHDAENFRQAVLAGCQPWR